MIRSRRSSDRGHTRLDWLESRHSFSFGDYRDPSHASFGALRVLNEDVVKAGTGFPAHPHEDMEIVTYVLSGALQHRDSLGNGSVLCAGHIQRMSAGTGIVHTESNASGKHDVHFFQIWIEPSEPGLDPSYEEKPVDALAVANKFARIASPEPLANEIRIVQDAEIWLARFDRDEEAMHTLAQGRRAWIHVVRGPVEVSGQKLETGDALAVSDEDTILLSAGAGAEVLLIDLV